MNVTQKNLVSFSVLLLSLSVPARADDGGRVGTGGGGDPSGCMTPAELRKQEAAYAESMKLIHAPRVSRIDSFNQNARSGSRCPIPTGEVSAKVVNETDPAVKKELASEMRCPKGLVRPSLHGMSAEMEKRMAPADDCRSVEIWSFYRSRANQKRLHDAPATCTAFVSAPMKPGEPLAVSAFSSYYCSKIPFFPSREAAKQANAQAPYAYAEGKSIVIEDGMLFSTTTTERYQQETVDGKVLGVVEAKISRLLMVPAGELPDGEAPEEAKDGQPAL